MGCTLKFEPTGLAVRMPVGRERRIAQAHLASAPRIAAPPRRETFRKLGQLRSPAKASSAALQSVHAEQSLICKVRVPSPRFCYQFFFLARYVYFWALLQIVSGMRRDCSFTAGMRFGSSCFQKSLHLAKRWWGWGRVGMRGLFLEAGRWEGSLEEWVGQFQGRFVAEFGPSCHQGGE